MTEEMKFFIYLLEHYAQYKNIGAEEVLKKLDELELTDFVYNMYEIYHQESIENAYKDIDELIKKRSK